MLYRSLALALSVPAVLAAGGHDNVQQCACAAANTEAPFTIDCTDIATINAATVTLETTCKTSTVEYQWGGAFATPANAYKWVAQAVGGAYADPAMKLVVFAVDVADSEHTVENANAAAGLNSDLHIWSPARTSLGWYMTVWPTRQLHAPVSASHTSS